MTKLAILHYLPLEYYPPVTNLIDYISKERCNDFKKIKVYTCKNVKSRVDYTIDRNTKQSVIDSHTNKQISICRSPFPKDSDKNLSRLLKYLHYNLFTLIGLITFRPSSLFYYESYSAWPAYVYTKYINRKCELYIHFHEYASKSWYDSTMRQVKYFHKLEKLWLYPHAKWISQTNSDRLLFFHQDHPNLKEEQLKIMPNYPPQSWQSRLQQPSNSKPETQNLEPIKLVYVGSLSFQNTYLKELCEWVLTQNGLIQFDVYAYNLYDDVKTYFQELNSPFINYFEEGIEYNDQPQKLSEYDVGLILYKAHNENYTYNAPNKLFEYLACDLDVWYPNVLHGPRPYNTKMVYPKVIPVDFAKLDTFYWQKTINKLAYEYQASKYFCENIYKEIVNQITDKV